MKKNNLRRDFLTKLGVFSSTLFITASAVYLYSPVVGSNATDNQFTKVTASINPVASLTLDNDKIALNVMPTSDGAFDSGSITATVSTNSTGGYELYFSSVDNDTDMTHSNSDISDVITSDFDGAVTSTSMAKDKWGYSLDNTNFYKIPSLANQTIIKNVKHYPTTEEMDTPVYIGTKISSAVASGTYSKNLVFSVLAHDSANILTIHSIFNMQDISPVICSNTTTPDPTATRYDWDGSHYGDTSYVPRTKLKDTRDGKIYLVSKLSDGNCWMSQNLALDITEGEPVIAATLDGETITATPDRSIQTEIGIKWQKTEDSWRSYKSQSHEAYYINNGTTKASAPDHEGDEYLWESAGNFYNWYAATAGTGTTAMTSGDANASLCAKGWRLPANTGDRSFVNLFTNGYGYTDLLTEQAGTAFRSDPFNFILGGGYNWKDMWMDHTEEVAFYWMSTAYDSTNAHRLSSRVEYIKPNGYYHKGYGFPIRCIAI